MYERLLTGMQISIHALREEGDIAAIIFYLLRWISIHALREEGDSITNCIGYLFPKFLSTPSARRATLIARKARPGL